MPIVQMETYVDFSKFFNIIKIFCKPVSWRHLWAVTRTTCRIWKTFDPHSINNISGYILFAVWWLPWAWFTCLQCQTRFQHFDKQLVHGYTALLQHVQPISSCEYVQLADQWQAQEQLTELMHPILVSHSGNTVLQWVHQRFTKLGNFFKIF